MKLHFMSQQKCWEYVIYLLDLPPTTQDYYILVGHPYKPLFVTVTGWGVDGIYIIILSKLAGHKWFPSLEG